MALDLPRSFPEEYYSLFQVTHNFESVYLSSENLETNRLAKFTEIDLKQKFPL